MSRRSDTAAWKLHKETVKAAWDKYNAATTVPRQIRDESIAKANAIFDKAKAPAWANLKSEQGAADTLYVQSTKVDKATATQNKQGAC